MAFYNGDGHIGSGNNAPARVGGGSGGGGGGDRFISSSSRSCSHWGISHNNVTINPELASLPIELDESYPPPLGWQKFLNLQTGAISYKAEIGNGCEANVDWKRMNPKLDLNLSLSPPIPIYSISSSSSSSSLHLLEVNSNEVEQASDGLEVASMKLMGCSICDINFMSSEEALKCPKCKSADLVDFVQGNTTKSE